MSWHKWVTVKERLTGILLSVKWKITWANTDFLSLNKIKFNETNLLRKTTHHNFLFSFLLLEKFKEFAGKVQRVYWKSSKSLSSDKAQNFTIMSSFKILIRFVTASICGCTAATSSKRDFRSPSMLFRSWWTLGELHGGELQFDVLVLRWTLYLILL